MSSGKRLKTATSSAEKALEDGKKITLKFDVFASEPRVLQLIANVTNRNLTRFLPIDGKIHPKYAPYMQRIVALFESIPDKNVAVKVCIRTHMRHMLVMSGNDDSGDVRPTGTTFVYVASKDPGAIRFAQQLALGFNVVRSQSLVAKTLEALNKHGYEVDPTVCIEDGCFMRSVVSCVFTTDTVYPETWQPELREVMGLSREDAMAKFKEWGVTIPRT